MAKLERELIGAIATARESVEPPANVTEAAALYGGNPGLAAAIAGTSDKSSKEYKAALRNVQRYRKAEAGEGGQGRRPSAAVRDLLDKLGKQKAQASVDQQMRTQGASVNVTGDVIVSPGGKRPDVRYDKEMPDVYLFPEDMAAILDKLDAGDHAGAADIFNQAFLSSYGISAAAVITDVADMDITAGATPAAMLSYGYLGEH